MAKPARRVPSTHVPDGANWKQRYDLAKLMIIVCIQPASKMPNSSASQKIHVRSASSRRSARANFERKICSGCTQTKPRSSA
eukprot:4390276-Prymnesium_polylepis.1